MMECNLSQKIKKQRLKYIILDVFAVLLAWFFFFAFRRLKIESNFIQDIQLFSPVYNFYKLLFGIPVYWLFVFWLSGYYNQPFHKSRLDEFGQTLFSTFFGCIGLFFFLLLNDPVTSYTDYYLSFCVLFLIYFLVVLLCRYVLTRIVTYNIHHRIWGFNTLIIGCGQRAATIYNELQCQKQSTGEIVKGFVSIGSEKIFIDKDLQLGSMADLDDILQTHQIEEVIIAMDADDKSTFYSIVNQLYTKDIEVRLTPSLYDFLVGGVRVSSIYGALLVNLFDVRMSEFHKNVKRLFDISASLFALLLLLPFLPLLAILIKISSDGPVFYQQERIGWKGTPFTIYKFRTMIVNSEQNAPQLSSVGDRRVTNVGRVLRKYRIDELPQFWNVLKGDMSIVGPRPERSYFEQQIAERAPYYRMIHKVRPGITSWGMVKYGYADTVDKMVERLNYDIIYLENLSIAIDLKILIYTVRTVLTGKGV